MCILQYQNNFLYLPDNSSNPDVQEQLQSESVKPTQPPTTSNTATGQQQEDKKKVRYMQYNVK